MNKLIILSGLLMLIILPMISADLIQPGYRPIEIQNKITNINDFPDYVFVSAGSLGGNPEGFGTDMCPVMKVPVEGTILSYYKFCTVSVYAIGKDKYNDEILFGYNSSKYTDKYGNVNATLAKEYSIELKDYLKSNAKEVITNLDSYEEVPEVSTQEFKVNNYALDLGKTLTEPNKIDMGRNNLTYLYMGVAILALIIIIGVIIYKRKK